MKMSDAGLQFLKHEEGCVLYVYKDQAGLDTIGVGHLLTPDDKTSGRFVSGITDQQAIDLLRVDAGKAEAAVNGLVKVPINQNQFDALCSFVFNVGSGALGMSSLLKHLNAGDLMGVPPLFLLWDKVRDPKTHQLVVSPGLHGRRQREAALWATTV